MKIIRVFTIPLIFAAFNASADVIYEQLPGANSFGSYTSSTLDGLGNSPGVRTADDFVLANDAIIADLHWWGRSAAGGTDFQFTFYADAAGRPGVILHTTDGSLSTASVTLPNGNQTTFYSSDLSSPFNAIAGTSYWISIFNEAADASWLWLQANDAGNLARQGQNPGPPWLSQPNNVAFQLTGTAGSVPEPSSLGLLALALALAGFSRRKRSSN